MGPFAAGGGGGGNGGGGGDAATGGRPLRAADTMGAEAIWNARHGPGPRAMRGRLIAALRERRPLLPAGAAAATSPLLAVAVGPTAPGARRCRPQTTTGPGGKAPRRRQIAGTCAGGTAGLGDGAGQQQTAGGWRDKLAGGSLAVALSEQSTPRAAAGAEQQQPQPPPPQQQQQQAQHQPAAARASLLAAAASKGARAAAAALPEAAGLALDDAAAYLLLLRRLLLAASPPLLPGVVGGGSGGGGEFGAALAPPLLSAALPVLPGAAPPSTRLALPALGSAPSLAPSQRW